eukprot:jgi/Mesen1/8096/ME000434S07339
MGANNSKSTFLLLPDGRVKPYRSHATVKEVLQDYPGCYIASGRKTKQWKTGLDMEKVLHPGKIYVLKARLPTKMQRSMQQRSSKVDDEGRYSSDAPYETVQAQAQENLDPAAMAGAADSAEEAGSAREGQEEGLQLTSRSSSIGSLPDGEGPADHVFSLEVLGSYDAVQSGQAFRVWQAEAAKAAQSSSSASVSVGGTPAAVEPPGGGPTHRTSSSWGSPYSGASDSDSLFSLALSDGGGGRLVLLEDGSEEAAFVLEPADEDDVVDDNKRAADAADVPSWRDGVTAGGAAAESWSITDIVEGFERMSSWREEAENEGEVDAAANAAGGGGGGAGKGGAVGRKRKRGGLDRVEEDQEEQKEQDGEREEEAALAVVVAEQEPEEVVVELAEKVEEGEEVHEEEGGEMQMMGWPLMRLQSIPRSELKVATVGAREAEAGGRARAIGNTSTSLMAGTAAAGVSDEAAAAEGSRGASRGGEAAGQAGPLGECREDAGGDVGGKMWKGREALMADLRDGMGAMQLGESARSLVGEGAEPLPVREEAAIVDAHRVQRAHRHADRGHEGREAETEAEAEAEEGEEEEEGGLSMEFLRQQLQLYQVKGPIGLDDRMSYGWRPCLPSIVESGVDVAVAVGKSTLTRLSSSGGGFLSLGGALDRALNPNAMELSIARSPFVRRRRRGSG